MAELSSAGFEGENNPTAFREKTGDAYTDAELDYEYQTVIWHSSKVRDFLTHFLWIWKDLSWCIYFGEMSMTVSILAGIAQVFVVILDSKKVSRFLLNASELMWLLGNMIWMWADMLYSWPEFGYEVSDLPLIKDDWNTYLEMAKAAMFFFQFGSFLAVIHFVRKFFVQKDFSWFHQDDLLFISLFWCQKDFIWVHYYYSEEETWNFFGIIFGALCLIAAIHTIIRTTQLTHLFVLAIVHFFWILSNYLWMISEFEASQTVLDIALVSFSLGITACVIFGFLLYSEYGTSRKAQQQASVEHEPGLGMVINQTTENRMPNKDAHQ